MADRSIIYRGKFGFIFYKKISLVHGWKHVEIPTFCLSTREQLTISLQAWNLKPIRNRSSGNRMKLNTLTIINSYQYNWTIGEQLQEIYENINDNNFVNIECFHCNLNI